MRHLRRFRSMIVLSLVVMTLTACGGESDDSGSSTAQPGDAVATDLAPGFADIAGWHNSDPLTLDALRGDPVFLIFFRDT